MKLVVKREPFTAALSAAAAIVPLRGARPSLKNALLIGDGEGNIEISIDSHDFRSAPVRAALSLSLGGHPRHAQLPHCVGKLVCKELDDRLRGFAPTPVLTLLCTEFRDVR